MNIAIVGATGLVGRTFLQILDERNISIDRLYLYASKRSAGTVVTFQDQSYTVMETTTANIIDKDIDIALFSAGSTVSTTFARDFVSIGAVVIDNSSAFRMDPQVPLVVPEVNPDDVLQHQGIIANPNCSTIQSVVPLTVVQHLWDIKRVDYTTYQAVSGSGQQGIDDFDRTAEGESPQLYPYPIYNNVIPQIDRFESTNFTFEEHKMIQETQKILHKPDLAVSATCVRVPVKHAHSVSMIIELIKEPDLERLREQLHATPGIEVIDDPEQQQYPMPLFAANQDAIVVGRIRKDLYNPCLLHMFCSADNIRKGAALNAIQILEVVDKKILRK
ncbi:aspartate-semialdehyde dehydrogenase [Candidatus Xianfuyuplasma coldseepsis]|uniref:Aspartate-semialdehyde dehydrogenase n=1 Tax=Candidatus Xianfuyuplasma coldseepsis TaxID=2782163 RepID=A0A7L7KQN3_9MOLU|nr:aspartate-semialdehyde dehydrogenase [Xianfuyuplasma coldseepsis]QMS84592.1 aspartate-semialdehyde dehydrogenase [Xianfuyuplasma coldseepsis]